MYIAEKEKKKFIEITFESKDEVKNFKEVLNLYSDAYLCESDRTPADQLVITLMYALGLIK